MEVKFREKLGEGACYSCIYAMWSHDLTESRKVKLSEKIVCGKRFGHKIYEVTGI